MGARTRKVYFDACILIYQVEGDGRFRPQIRAAMKSTARLVGVASDLVRLECLVGPLRTSDRVLAEAFKRRFRRLRIQPMTRAVFDKAARLRAWHRLKTPDALHVAAALEAGCTEFWTGDRRLAPVGDRIALRVFEAPAA